MKHRIAFNMWEKKKNLIIQLYREEGWPLKQVVKRVRSHEFDLSENQLRGRLKKWCITKSSRHQKWPKSLTNENRADPTSNNSFVQTAANEVLSTAKIVSAEQTGITAIALLSIDPRLSQTPSLPVTSALDGNNSTPHTYSSK
ncbi:hypothetical protein BDV33DRAFT_210937 [Aspergillus novoparasiticus]|uniref:Clr5 domain-containing protein n=1 Tax=Aspergillus novoparasiticus TaxID=986946 RepID=A0A5N6E662_9EURO|nr:hypothetical protein BDV33DRAFT_210937 [Aspergillus novoparasiticus]